MMQTEESKLTLEDRRELEWQIKDIEKRLKGMGPSQYKEELIKEHRRLRRMRA